MPKVKNRTYSKYCREAMLLLSQLIRISRKEKKFTVQQVADRAGVSRGLLQRIEKGDLKCEIGVVLEIAAIIGVKLFDSDKTPLKQQIGLTNYRLALLPKAIRKKEKEVDDNF